MRQEIQSIKYMVKVASVVLVLGCVSHHEYHVHPCKLAVVRKQRKVAE